MLQLLAMEPSHSLIYIFFTSFAIAFSGAMMPGPMLAVTIREAAHRGFWAGPLVVAGHAILELTLVVGLLFGLAALFARPLFLGATGLAGGAVLVWMAASMLRAVPGLTLDLEAGESTGPHPVIGGIVTSVSNPYFILWWATAGLACITMTLDTGWPGVAAFYTGHILADLVWYTLISTILHFGRSFLTDRRYRWLVGILAVALLYFGGYFAVTGFMKLKGLA